MRPLKSHFPAPALTTLATLLQQTQEARVFRRAQAVHAVVAGHHISAVSATFHVANSALRKWVQRFAQEGPPGLRDRPRSGRPPTVTCALEQHLNRLVDQDPLEHGSLHSPWSCRELATGLTQQTGVQLGRESVRGGLKKMRSAPAVPLDGSNPPRLLSPMALWNSPALEYRARRGEIVLLYEDATIVWRFALPRLGWWRRAQRYRLPTRPLNQSQIKQEESRKRQTWVQNRAWSRITSGVLLSVIGAVQYGTAKVCYNIQYLRHLSGG
jgi:transposase